jgi:hypothetical protein
MDGRKFDEHLEGYTTARARAAATRVRCNRGAYRASAVVCAQTIRGTQSETAGRCDGYWVFAQGMLSVAAALS